ncbi:MAG: Lrp/AsnC family transcriptional regulator [Pseudooceanicola sp.]
MPAFHLKTVYDAKMDQIDVRIIQALQSDGRLTNVELAERVNLSPSPCLRRVRLLEERGLITGYRAEIGRKAAGLSLTVFVEVSVARHSRENAQRVQDKLAALPGAVSCHMVSGDADFLIEVAVADLTAYEALLSDHILCIEDVTNIRSNFVLRTVCQNAPLTLPDPKPRA